MFLGLNRNDGGDVLQRLARVEENLKASTGLLEKIELKMEQIENNLQTNSIKDTEQHQALHNYLEEKRHELTSTLDSKVNELEKNFTDQLNVAFQQIDAVENKIDNMTKIDVRKILGMVDGKTWLIILLALLSLGEITFAPVHHMLEAITGGHKEEVVD